MEVEELYIVDGDDLIPLVNTRYNVSYNVDKDGNKEIVDYKAMYKGKKDGLTYIVQVDY